MKEIEVKAWLRNKEEVMQKLSALGCSFEDPVTQEDAVYALKNGSLETYLSNRVFARLRVKNKTKTIFTVKRPLENWLDKIEHETEVASYEHMEGALFEMGYVKVVQVNKTRIVTHVNGCEICIDEIDDLGTFIEMEKCPRKTIQKRSRMNSSRFS